MEVQKWNLTDGVAVGKILYKSQNLRNGASIILYALKPIFYILINTVAATNGAKKFSMKLVPHPQQNQTFGVQNHVAFDGSIEFTICNITLAAFATFAVLKKNVSSQHMYVPEHMA